MGSNRKIWKKLAMAIAVPGVAMGTLAGVAAAPAMAGTAHPHGHPIETIRGSGNGNSGNVNVRAAGAFSDRGHLNLNSTSGFTEVYLSRGSLFTVHGKGSTTTSIRRSSCFVTSQTTTNYRIYGGTGRYRHISGSGTASITVTGVLPRLRHGRCDSSAAPLPWTEHTTFVARGPVNLR
jgi:hypothetical protein